MTSPFHMTPAGELVAAGFERARLNRLLARRVATARAWVEAGRIDAEAGAMFVTWCETTAEMARLRLFDDDADAVGEGGEG